MIQTRVQLLIYMREGGGEREERGEREEGEG